MGWCGREAAWTRAVAILSFGLAAMAGAGESSAGAGAKGWEKLHLSETTLAGTTVYYEKSLEPNLPAFERELAKLSADRAKLAEVLARRQEIIADINRILGATDAHPEDQDRMFVQVAGLFAKTRLTFHLVTRITIIDFLKSGGQLPDFSYDPVNDTAAYNLKLQILPGAEPPETYDFCVPIAPAKAFEQQILSVRWLERVLGAPLVQVAIHEVTEMTLLRKARPTDPCWRWFSDGFANAITCTLLEKYVDKEAAGEFARAYDPNAYRDLARQINLRYWMLGDYCVYTTEIPVKAEAAIQQARYAYATVEARRLIDTCGIACIRQILDRVVGRNERGAGDLLQVIKDVTGEDMESRLLAYQDFDGMSAGLAKYSAACQAAASRKDLQDLFVNLMRLMEVCDVSSPGRLQNFLEAAVLLFRMGHEDAADQAMQNCMHLYSRDAVKRGWEVAREAFVNYTLICGQPRKGEKMADELLAKYPNHVPSLLVKMQVCMEDGNKTQAQDYAKRIMRLTQEQSPPYWLAAKVLGVDPNRPAEYKEPIGPK